MDATTGSHAHKASILKVATSLQPHEFVQAILDEDAKLIQERSTADLDDVNRILAFLRQKDLAEILKLETTIISDMPMISFEVEPGKKKPINALATGTKSIVVVSLAMVEGNVPLVIDQLEDSLNTEFIYEQIVGRLRNEKELRQFVLTSHNANIVVAGETDLTHVLTATFDQGSIESSGGIDDPVTNKQVLLHLEGGPDAFRLRARKYEQSLN